jgi:putative flippase GtrA
MTNAMTHAYEVVRFLAAGGLAAAANVLSRVVFSYFFPLSAAVVLAYLVGMAVAFVLMRRFVFPPGRLQVHRQVVVFVLVNLAAAVQTLVVTLLLAKFVLPSLGLRRNVDLISHIVGVCVPIVTSFVGHKRWSFR